MCNSGGYHAQNISAAERGDQANWGFELAEEGDIAADSIPDFRRCSGNHEFHNFTVEQGIFCSNADSWVCGGGYAVTAVLRDL